MRRLALGSSSNRLALALLLLAHPATLVAAPLDAPISLPSTAELVGSDAPPGLYAGWSVAVQGETAVVGAWTGSFATESGAVYVFVKTNGTWSEQAKLVPVGAAYPFDFGRAVAIDGDTVVVGAQDESGGAGAFYVFQRTGSAWDAGERRTIPGAVNVGCSVAIEGGRMAIGACDGVGRVYIFENTTDGWVEEQMLIASGAVGSERLGSALDLQGDRLLVGAPQSAASAPSGGRAYLFTYDGSTWSQAAVLEPTTAVTDAQFGAAVAIDNEFIAVGAPAVAVPLIGSVYVFSEASGTWQQEAQIPAVAPELDERFGSALAMREGRLVVGAHNAGSGNGGAWVFKRAAGEWVRHYDLSPIGADGQSRFGLSVALADRTLIVGAPYGTPAGSAFVFDVDSLPAGTFTYCVSAPNVTGQPCLISGSGSVSLASNDFQLEANNLPPHAFGLFLCAFEPAQIPMAGGHLCVSPYAPGGLVRLGPVAQADAFGFASHALDLSSLPEHSPIVAGSTCYFQLWYRDVGPGGYNLSNGLCATFEP